MEYFNFQGQRVSRLGFGAMRLPVIDGNAGNIDQEAVQALIDRALEGGVNYFDTAYIYHLGKSEASLCQALEKHPRESYLLADKFPGHEIRSVYKPAEIFQEQIDRCGVDYFDFYLLHNVTELSIDTYLDPRWNMVEFALEQKAAGRIRHVGFSTHGRLDTIQRFMERYGEHMEFCQLQVNYVDWSLQKIKEKYDYVSSFGIPVWVMEPLRGGLLAQVNEETAQRMAALRPQETPAAWAFRWLQSLNNIGVTLSGMNSFQQLEDNLATFSTCAPLSAEETQVVEDFGAELLDRIPCTSCRYCVHHCPLELDIPNLLEHANNARLGMNYTIRMGIDALPPEKRPDACIACGACMQACPQNINIPQELATLQTEVDKLPTWAETRKYD